MAGYNRRPTPPRYSVGQEVAGIRVSEYQGHHITGQGKQHVYKVVCGCGAEFIANQKILVNKWRDLDVLRCPDCTNKRRTTRTDTWTEQEIQLLRARYRNHTAKELTKFIERSVYAIEHKLYQLKITKRTV